MTQHQPTHLFSRTPPEAPRAVTPQARRRSWGEPSVRRWWISGLTLLTVGLATIAIHLSASLADQRLITQGLPVDAEILKAGGNPIRGKVYEPALNLPFTLRFIRPGTGVPATVASVDIVSKGRELTLLMPLPDGNYAGTFLLFTSGELKGHSRQIDSYDPASRKLHLPEGLPGPAQGGDRVLVGAREHVVEGRLKDQRVALGPGMVLPLRVDPADFNRWTDRQAMTLVDFIAALALLPPGALALAVALLQRRRILRVWRTGQPLLAMVVDTRHSPLAPRSRIVRFVLSETEDQRVASTLVPLRAGAMQPGDTFWAIAPGPRPKRAIVAALYDPGSGGPA